MNKSKCCGADVTEHYNFLIFVGYSCNACEKPCDLAPALRDSKEVLEFLNIEKQKAWDLQASVFCRNRGETVKVLNFISRLINFIEGK